ncbi:PilZ domain-containing protein [Sphingomonas sp. AOB5]|uniref:PilZ domain-containing protein n=1 Tax=Sphingomonas sp. AOB5 TaxID=3034017 RepID=UPI0023F68935|nr:PilZ domain-containing protein [Sphingomonas sp. AOB5]MDF7777943.1 PilZ domain-containing protein [Sphingomonas sp. AOB5]
MLVARLEVLGSTDRRGAIRYEVDSGSTLRGLDGEPFDVIVTDFSRTGFAFVGEVDLPIGTVVSVGLSGAGARGGRIVWCGENCYGCEFLEPLPEVLMAQAFRGQKHRIAELEAELARRDLDRADPEPPVPPAPPSGRGRLFRLIRRRRR